MYMSNLTIRFNGEELKEVTGISYLEGISKLRVISKLDGKLVSNDYGVESIVIDMTGSKVGYKVPVMCMYDSSDKEFIGCIGRYCTTVIDNDGLITIIDNDLHWIKLKVDKTDVNRVRDIASIGLGSLYVEVNSSGLGKIYNRTIGFFSRYLAATFIEPFLLSSEK